MLSLAWSTAQLGWVAGPATLVVFAVITYYTSVLLADCYRAGGDQVSGKRNYTYMDAVESYLGTFCYYCCCMNQRLNDRITCTFSYFYCILYIFSCVYMQVVGKCGSVVSVSTLTWLELQSGTPSQHPSVPRKPSN